MCFLVQTVDIASSSCQSSVTFINSGIHEAAMLEYEPSKQLSLEVIDWENLEIQASHDEEGIIETIGHDQMLFWD